MKKKAIKPTKLEKEVYTSLHKMSAFLEKTRLAEYMDLMHRPGRLIWLNFLAGTARGVGLVVGGSILSVILIVVLYKAAHYAFQHVGGLPWVGYQMEQGLQWFMDIVEKYKATH
ncbi:MAG: DUF5665 domain-containing protein [candidate division FCPU426 bacterium]